MLPTPQKIHVTMDCINCSSQFKVLVCIAEHITPVFQSHSEVAPDDNDFPQIIFRAGANSCLFNSCNTNTVRCMPSDPGGLILNNLQIVVISVTVYAIVLKVS